MNLQQNNRVRLIIGSLGLLVLGALGGRALATGAPSLSPLTYTGVVTDKTGKPWATAVPVSVAFYDKADAPTAKCTSPIVQAEAGTGRFQVVLPAECAQAVHDTPDLWAEPVVGDTKTVLPRTHVGAVPYALEADSAKTAAVATGALKTSLDALQADVAALKSAAGGGGKGGAPQVHDGAGALLGTLIDIQPASGSGPETVRMVTPGGALLTRFSNGAIPYGFNIAYSGNNCTGTPYLVVGQQPQMSNVAVYDQIAKKWFVTKPTDSQNYCYAQGTTTVASMQDIYGMCTNINNYNNNSQYVCSLSATTAAALGLPDTIAPGLSFKAP